MPLAASRVQEGGVVPSATPSAIKEVGLQPVIFKVMICCGLITYVVSLLTLVITAL